jgi:hypothetical protein
MNLNDLIKEDLDDVFFDPKNGICEPATYNGIALDVLPEIGAELQGGNTINSDGFSDRAIFGVKVSDVPSPSGKDIIVHAGKTWYVVRLLKTDAVMHKLECIGSVSPHRLK